ncbi:lipid A deacylase LpxR family protein [bacterium]|nr:lipid A deacylase LpxR family protein [bacterium]MBU1882801.1 lipid A deacylase LpxR family protein [bacterium]
MRLFRLLPILCSVTLFADQFSFQIYNDYFAGTDKHFTNGVSISWLDSNGQKDKSGSTTFYSDAMAGLIDSFPNLVEDGYRNYTAGASISQIMITPKDTTQKTAQYDDIPYAGYLALSLFAFEWDDESFKEYRGDFGVVGPEAGAENVQKSFHRLIGNPIPQGWDTQLRTHYIANALFRYGNKTWSAKNSGDMSSDWFNHIGFQAGNFTSDIFIGSMFRFGYNYVENFNVHYPYLREEAALLNSDGEHQGFGWSFTIGANGEYLAYSYILDAAKDEGYQTEKNPFNGAGYAGLDFYYDAHKLTLFYQAQTSMIKSQNSVDVYGGITYTYQF